MGIEDNFKRQRSIYLFYTLFPILLFSEIFIYIYTDPFQAGREIVPFLFGALLLIESSIVFLQFVSKRRFLRQIREMSEEEKHVFLERPLLIGSVLVNESFVIEYRMFRKRIIPIKEIFRAKFIEEECNGRAGSIRVSFAMRHITLLRIGKRQINMKAPVAFIGKEPEAIVNSINHVIQGEKIREGTKNIYAEYDGDFPFYGIFVLGLVGILFFLNRIYIPFMDLFINKKDDIEYFLFHVGYDRYFQVGMFVIVALYAAVSFFWKYSYMGINFDSILSNFVPLGILLILFFAMISLADYEEISLEARKDFVNYKNGDFEYIETMLEDEGNYFWGKDNKELENLTKRLEIRRYLNIEQDKYLFGFGSTDIIVKERKYQIKYLKNTSIITEIQEMD